MRQADEADGAGVLPQGGGSGSAGGGCCHGVILGRCGAARCRLSDNPQRADAPGRQPCFSGAGLGIDLHQCPSAPLPQNNHNHFVYLTWGSRMKLLNDLFTTNYGLMSITGIAMMLIGVVTFAVVVRRKMNEDPGAGSKK
ncbi:MAG: hypothetical protein C0492_01080 [Verminephrobacter sp.]|nr:hypothetical protein [Verminephrobacter sp.]